MSLFQIGLPWSLLFWLSYSVMSDSSRTRGLQHTRLPLSFTISWSLFKLMSIEPVMPSNHLILCRPLLLLPSVFPSIRVSSFFLLGLLGAGWGVVSGFLLISQLFTSGGQNIGTSASASVLPMNLQDWFSLVLTGLISLQSKGLTRVIFSTTVQKCQFFGAQPSLGEGNGNPLQYSCLENLMDASRSLLGCSPWGI